IDEARWRNSIVDDEPTCTWDDFLRAYDEALTVVQRPLWIEEWKRAGPDRSVCIDVVGKSAYSETGLDFFVLPAWQDAGLAGVPEFEVTFHRCGIPAGRLFLARESSEALVLNATPGLGEHWFD